MTMQTKNKQKNKRSGSRFIKSYSTCLKRSPEYSKGFTLIELMVATSIFVVIMLASMGSLFTLLDASKNSRALRTAMDNVNFAMESMTRSIRMGTDYSCEVESNSHINCPNGGTLISFTPQDSSVSRVVYKWKTEGVVIPTIQRCKDGDCVAIVSEGVNIQKLKFFVKGSGNADNIQASVYIIMKGTVLVKGVATSFALQTMASQRNF